MELHHYETVFILNPVLSDEQAKEVDNGELGGPLSCLGRMVQRVNHPTGDAIENKHHWNEHEENEDAH